MRFYTKLRAAALSATIPAVLVAQSGKELPLKYVGPATKTEITAGDLMTRLYIFADDSMMGRQVGTIYNNKGTDYIAAEVQKLGLKPGGENGGYFQTLPYVLRALDSSSTITAGGVTLHAGVDFLSQSSGHPTQYDNMPTIFVGTQFDTTAIPSNDMVRGKLVFLRAGPPLTQALFSTAGFRRYQAAMAGAIVVTMAGNQLAPAALANMMRPVNPTFLRDNTLPPSLLLTDHAAEVIMGAPLASLTPGATGKPVSSNIKFNDDGSKVVGRNVVAILEGTDSKLKGQYVAIGAHNDHIGFRAGRAVDSDSVKAFMQIVRPQGADNKPTPATPDQVAMVRILTDSLHKLHGGARLDSVYNGADDDGSGSVSVLEIAEAFAHGKVRPKRSIVFVWHAGEEAGMLGSGLYTDHPLPSVARDSIVAQLNMDMVGRGRATDATGEAKDGSLLHGGEGYLQLVGSRRLSTELGDLVEKVNKDDKFNFNFDYNMDANGHPQNIYCRSDHWSYAKWGIPVVFMTTGGHADYHQITDEPQYIDYDHMAQIDKFVFALALKTANLDHRIVVDKPKPDPKGPCQQ
jgi:Peptidase family M28